MNNITTEIQINCNVAIKTLVDICKDKKASSLARVNSAKTILEFAYKGLELENIQNKIEKLEEVITIEAS